MLVASLAIAFLAAAAPDTGALARDVGDPVQIIRIQGTITIDGVLNEATWQAAPAVTDFKQRDPYEGAAPSQRTEVRVAYDDNALYVAAHCYDTAPDSILARLCRRDVSIQADRFCVYLDPYRDKRSGYYFMVTAAGTLLDGTLMNDGWDDNSWDGVWTGRARLEKDGWTAEMRIPFSQLRFHDGKVQEWGINFGRAVARRNEVDYVVYKPKNGSGFVSRFPPLEGLGGIHAQHAIEITPYVTGKSQFAPPTQGDPFFDGSKGTSQAGGDLRMGVGSGLTLNATVNPDFGQVEVDPAVVNLSDVESYFPEKRPFFVEGSSIFEFGNQGADDYWGFNWPEPTFFYSRRIGRAPQGDIPDSAYSETPTATRILGAAKITGKLGSSINFGTLHAVTEREVAKLSNGIDHTEVGIEPMTYYGIARGLKEFKDRRFGLGMMGTLAARSFQDDGLEATLPGQSAMAGFDGWSFLDRKKVWVISGWSAMSYLHGSESSILDVQESSRHYLQRPDASPVKLDPDATSLTGFGSRYWLNKQSGAVIVNAAAGFMTPKFDVNDMGFMTRADVINSHVGGGYKWTTPNKVFKYQDVLASVFTSYDFDGNHVSAGVWGGGYTNFVNNWGLNYKFAYNPETMSNRRTRGGPLMVVPPGYEVNLNWDTDGQRKRYYYIDFYSYVRPTVNAYVWNVGPGIELKPTSNFSFRFGPNYERNIDDAQYILTQPDPTATATYGSRYVFARLDQTTVGATVRINWAFTPNLSLQSYFQPLISAGHYTEFKELARGASYEFNVYGSGSSTYDPASGVADPDGSGPAAAFEIGNQDFNYKSLRGNAVLRWEYMPGSAFFLVWTQERTNTDSDGSFDMTSDTHKLFQLAPTNIYLAKVSYYFNM